MSPSVLFPNLIKRPPPKIKSHKFENITSYQSYPKATSSYHHHHLLEPVSSGASEKGSGALFDSPEKALGCSPLLSSLVSSMDLSRWYVVALIEGPSSNLTLGAGGESCGTCFGMEDG